MTTKEDNELVYEVIHGSISSFEILVDRYQKTIFNIMLRMVGDFETAKDLTQDVFVKAFEKMGGFDFKYRFFSWIYRIAVNEAINWNRKKQPMVRLEEVDPMLIVKPETTGKEVKNKLLHQE
jgi:RNA polymerase sigma-70 factor (ECF subfamily)